MGNAVTATDADNDPLLYSLDKVTVVTDLGADNAPGGTDANADETTDVVIIDLGDDNAVGGTDDNADTTVDVTTLFAINNKSGQISVKGDADLGLLNIEAYPSTTVLTDDATAGDNTATVTTIDLAYDVLVTATDPSGSTSTVTVRISVNEVNEAPAIERSGDKAPDSAEDRTTGGDFVVTTPEQVELDLRGISGAVGFAGLPVFEGRDPEGKNDVITWSLSGADAKRFQIANIRPQNGDGYVGRHRREYA